MRLLISGYYGFANLGDEALLQAMIAQIRRRLPYAEIDVLSATPEQTSHELRVDATPRSDVRAVMQAIRRADVVISGGGGLLQTATSLRSVFYYAGILRSGIRAKKRTMIFAQSIGPLDFLGRQVVRRSLRGLSAATVRDERSRVILASLLPDVDVRLSADPVFLIDEPEPAADLEMQGLGEQSDPLVLVSVRPWKQFDACATRVAAAVDRLAGAHRARVGFVPFGGAEDAEACTVVMRKCRTNPTLLPVSDVASVMRMFSRARLVIGMRLHAIIIAMRLGVPFLAVAYDPKVSGLCEDIGYPLAPLWSVDGRAGASPQDLADAAWTRRDELATHVRSAAETMQARAGESFTILERLAAEAGRPGGGRAEGMAFA